VADEDPRGGRCQGSLEVLGEPSATAEPANGALHDPATWQQHEPPGGSGSFDDLDGPLADPGQGVTQLVASVATIGEDLAQPPAQGADRGQEIDGAIAILDVGGVDHQAHQVALRVGNDVALTAFDLLAGVISPWPPLSVVFTDWLSITPALGSPGAPPLAAGHAQYMVDLGEGSIPGPAVEIALHRGIGRKFPRDLSPLAAGRGHLEDRFGQPAAGLSCAVGPPTLAVATAARSAPTPHPSDRLRSAAHRADIAAGWFQSRPS
jgi:hypothetical protein